MKNLLKPKLKLVPGTRLISFLFIGVSVLIAAGILWAANMYYNIDTGEVVVEEIKRVTGVLRATGGVIVGGTASQNPTVGYGFESATSSLFSSGDVVLSAANQLLRFTGGTSYYVGFKAPTTLTTTTVYTWPSAYPAGDNYILASTQSGAMSWLEPGQAGLGDITAVGDVASGEAFTSTGTQGTSLWFYDPQGRGQLTIADLTAARTYTLPDLSGIITLASGNLGTGGILFANADLIATSSNLYWDNATRYLQIGSTGNQGQLRIYSSNASGYYLGFAAPSTMTQTTLYYWPTNYGTNNYVLTTDGTGVLSWKSISGAGGVDTFGTPSSGQVSFFYDSDTIQGDAGMTYSTGTQKLTLAGGLIAPLIESTAALTIQSGTGDITLNPASGIVQLGSGDYLRTGAGYEIGRAGTQVLREMIPILGFDLPVQTATTSYVQISRTIEDYPFSPALTGTTRIHKFVIRYADATTTASTTWRVWNETQATTTATFEVPPTASTNLDKGEAYITPAITIPTNTDDWRLDLLTSGAAIRVYQIFLAAYDQIQ